MTSQDPPLIYPITQPKTKEEVEHILHPLIKKWFYSRFPSFSLPQKYAVTQIHSRKNILVSAPTGATKTLTSFLAILNELVDAAEKGILENKIYAVYISPLKALNYDIEHNLKIPLKEIEAIAGKELGIRVATRTGDTTAKEKAHMLKNPPHILITTPESLGILLSSIKFSQHLTAVDWTIIDEIHALAEGKRGTHLALSLEQLSYLSPHLTRVGLSATVAPLNEIAEYLVGPTRPCGIVDVQFIKQTDFKVLCPVPDMIDVDHETLHNNLYRLLHKLIQEHKTTLIFTNTRSATERVVHYLKDRYPKDYTEQIIDKNIKKIISEEVNKDKETNKETAKEIPKEEIPKEKPQSLIGAHHGSLSKEHRKRIENQLREGKLKCVVCSTSLELGLDIGYIDLVICLGSPKSVARALQRIGRSGHNLKDTTKGRIIVLDRDDLVECAVLLKAALEKKIDRVHIPTNCLDVLAQQISGMALQEVWEEKKLFNLLKQTYPYKDLSWSDFNEVLDYLAGVFASLEDRYVYAKIWRKDGKIGRRGKMMRVIYMTNIGTIPDESFIVVKMGSQIIGHIDEGFLEKLKPGDIFVLGGETYAFKYTRGMVAQVSSAYNRSPTVPSWFSEMLPLSFDLAMEIGRFRRLLLEQFSLKKPKEEILNFIDTYLYVDKNGANAIYEYFSDQYEYVKKIPTDRTILVEHCDDPREKKVIFHTLFGRRVNDCLSRALAFAIAKSQHRDVGIGINDNGFYLSYKKPVNVLKAFSLLRTEKLDLVVGKAIDRSEILKRRFRHCASRALMILRNYKGNRKSVGKQQISSQLLINAVKRISEDFVILKEARREVMYDLMDVEHAKEILSLIKNKKMRIVETNTIIPSPFAFNLSLQGYLDILKLQDRMEFLKKMHEMVQIKIGRRGLSTDSEEFAKIKQEFSATLKKEPLSKNQKRLLNLLDIVDLPATKKAGLRLLIIKGTLKEQTKKYIEQNRIIIQDHWPKILSQFLISACEKDFSYGEYWQEQDNLEENKAEEERENLLIDFKNAAKRINLDPQIQYDLVDLINNPKNTPLKLRQDTIVWINGLLSGSVPKIWSDRVVKFLREKRREL